MYYGKTETAGSDYPYEDDSDERKMLHIPAKKSRLVTVWAQRIKDLRLQNNLTQSDVAKVLHITQASYGMYELGKRQLPVDKLVDIAKFYHVSVDYVTGVTDDF
nr:helix-turn-helix transcriptional regulator [uncultured Mitsuokella sp.]